MNGGGVIIITGEKSNGTKDSNPPTISASVAKSAVDWINAQNPPSGSAEATLATDLQSAINYATG